ncbi:MAG: xanthine phosphoribosyltransferase, partial [Clostridia bacterium]|nr:xanthine phosphoribosyltransferase [Clostridia bacterium]
MKLLEEKILKEGKVLAGDVLKVDCFLNHQMDVAFLNELGKEIYERFKDKGINKILTVEASGIGLACLTAQYFNCKVLVGKKHKSLNVSPNVYSAKVYSYTHKTE